MNLKTKLTNRVNEMMVRCHHQTSLTVIEFNQQEHGIGYIRIWVGADH